MACIYNIACVSLVIHAWACRSMTSFFASKFSSHHSTSGSAQWLARAIAPRQSNWKFNLETASKSTPIPGIQLHANDVTLVNAISMPQHIQQY